ncbi:hypothetical protein KY362_02680 [Candidatus Woesearchaeota archaeon]|nr:hypothetical protein [Candidatus Woesearchaeota archaeon]
MTFFEPGKRESGLREVRIDEPKGVLDILLKTAKKEEKLILLDSRKALKKIKRANRMVKSYRTDIFGESYGVKRLRRFQRRVNDALQLTVSTKIRLPLIETIAKEVKEWLVAHKKENADILPADDKIIQDVRRTTALLNTAVKNLKEIEHLDWGSTSAGLFQFGMYYIPVERQSDKMVGLKFRADWIKYLNKASESLEEFEKAVEGIFELQKQINIKYRA